MKVVLSHRDKVVITNHENDHTMESLICEAGVLRSSIPIVDVHYSSVGESEKYLYRPNGPSGVLNLRVRRGSSDDRFFNEQIDHYLSLKDQKEYELLYGVIGMNGGGSACNGPSEDVYYLESGIIQDYPDVKGDVAKWSIFFGRIKRVVI